MNWDRLTGWVESWNKKINWDRFVGWIESWNERMGRFTGWLMFILVLLVTLDVLFRWLFNTGYVAVQELEWWLFSIIFLLGAGYTFLHDGHVRVDIVYSRLSKKWQHIIDLGGAFIFLFPMCTLVIWSSHKFIVASWGFKEGTADPGGLPAYYILKAMIPLGFFFLALQGVAEVIKILKKMKEDA